MGVRSQVDQEHRVCIESRNMYSCGHWINRLKAGKVDGFELPEDSSPGNIMVSDQDTTGILDQVMCSWG